MSAASEMDPGQAAFALCELEWMRSRLLVQLSCGELTQFREAVAEGVGEASADLVGRVRVAMDEVETLVMSLLHRVAGLPSTGVRATGDDVAAAAVALLEEGVIDADRALHAAQWVDVRVGLGALARSLTLSDCSGFWDVRVEQFVAAFRGANRQLARAVARDAEVVDLTFSELSTRQLERLVAALERAHRERA